MFRRNVLSVMTEDRFCILSHYYLLNSTSTATSHASVGAGAGDHDVLGSDPPLSARQALGVVRAQRFSIWEEFLDL